MGFFSSKQRKQFRNLWIFTTEYKEPTEMPKATITFAQAVSLKEQGLMTQEKFDEWVTENSDQVFTYRAQKNKPEIVIEVHDQIIDIISNNALALYNSGYKPSIIWHSIAETTEPDMAQTGPVNDDPFA